MQVGTGNAEGWACTSSLLQVVELGGLENGTKCSVILFQLWVYGRVRITGETGTDLGRTHWFELLNGWCLYRVWWWELDIKSPASHWWLKAWTDCQTLPFDCKIRILLCVSVLLAQKVSCSYLCQSCDSYKPAPVMSSFPAGSFLVEVCCYLGQFSLCI